MHRDIAPDNLMLDTAGHDDKLARPQLDNPVPELDAKAAPPDQKHLFHVVVVVPRERAVETSDADHGIIDRHEILGLERFQQISCGGRQRDRCHARSVTTGTASVSCRSQRPCGRPNRRDSRSRVRPATSYGGGLRPCGLVHFYTTRRVSRISARQTARARTRNELRACDAGCAHFIWAGQA